MSQKFVSALSTYLAIVVSAEKIDDKYTCENNIYSFIHIRQD